MKKSLEKEKKNNAVDIIHAHCYRSYQTDISYKIARQSGENVKKGGKIPFVISTHGTLLAYRHFVKFPWTLLYDIYDLLTLKRAAKDADALIVNSTQEYYEALKFGVNRKKLHIIPVGINVDEYKTKRCFKDKKKLELLFVGRITRNRPLIPMLKAVKIINTGSASQKKVRLNIVGGEAKSSDAGSDGYLDEVKMFVKKAGISDEVRFFPQKNKDELKEFYKDADVFVYPSVYESFGQPVLEAAASGLPVLCSEIGIASDLFDNDDLKEIIIDNNPKHIAEKINFMFDSKLRERLSRNALNTIKTKFTWKKIIEEYVGIYESL
jgi:glycosyltransferase involved in cell wall biosynthesis